MEHDYVQETLSFNPTPPLPSQSPSHGALAKGHVKNVVKYVVYKSYQVCCKIYNYKT